MCRGTNSQEFGNGKGVSMELKASDIQKQRIKEIEEKADELVQKCSIMFVSSVNEKGYPRVCCVNKLSDKGFRSLF